MNFKQCVIFREVSRERNFTKAAAKLFITQSAVSHAIKDLEAEAKTQLVERLPRGIRLTPAGQYFLRGIEPILKGFSDIEAQLPHLMCSVPIRIASCLTYGQSALPEFIAQLHQAGFVTEVVVVPAFEALLQLEQGRVELAFLEGSIPSDGFLCKTVANYQLSFLAAPGFKRTLPQQLTINELLKQPLLVRERGSAVREALEAVLTLKNRQLKPAWESTDSQILLTAAAAGFGITMLPRILAEKNLAAGSLAEVLVSELTLSYQVTAMMRKSSQNMQLDKIWQLI